MKLILCRHGETDFNVQRRLQGWMDTPINAHGRQQAKLVAERLKHEHFDHAFCSTLLRARQTFGEVMKYHREIPFEFRPELREIDLGIYDGMDRHEIEEKFPGVWAKRVDSKYDFHHEGGESYKSVDEKRVKPMLQELKEKYSSRAILLLCHQGIAKLIIGNLLGLTPAQEMHVAMPHDCIYFMEYRPHKTAIRHELLESNAKGEGYLRH